MEEVSDVPKIKEAVSGRGKFKPKIWLVPKPSSLCSFPGNAVGIVYTFYLPFEHSLASISIHPSSLTTHQPHTTQTNPASWGLGLNSEGRWATKFGSLQIGR